MESRKIIDMNLFARKKQKHWGRKQMCGHGKRGEEGELNWESCTDIYTLASCSVMSALCNTRARLPCPSPISQACSDSRPLSQWCHPIISSSVIPFSSCPQSFPASGSFQMSQFFASGSQSTGVSASASVLPVTIQNWFPLGWTGWISLQSKGLSRVFSNTTVQKHQLFGTQLSL